MEGRTSALLSNYMCSYGFDTLACNFMQKKNNENLCDLTFYFYTYHNCAKKVSIIKEIVWKVLYEPTM